MSFRGGLVGLGAIALRSHAPAYAGVEGLTLAAACDPLQERRREAVQVAPGLRTYARLEELLEREQLDFLDVCTPPRAHAEVCEQAAARGLHVLCEKPGALNLREASGVRRAFQRCGKLYVPCLQYRYSAVWSRLRRWLGEGRAGRLGCARIEVQRTGADRGAFPAQPPWRTRPQDSGGGILADTGIHYLDLFLHLLGPPTHLHLRSTRLHEAEVEDTLLLVLDYPGCWAELSLTWSGQGRVNRVWFAGERGSAVYDGVCLRLQGEECEEVGEDLTEKGLYVGWYSRLLSDFARALAGDPSPRLPRLEDWYAAFRLMHTCYRSARSGRRVSFS